MKIMVLLFLVVSFSILNAMIAQDIYEEAHIQFPKFPNFAPEFMELGDCGSITGCIRLIGASLVNFSRGVISLIQFAWELIAFVLGFVGMILNLLVKGVDGAPWYANAFIQVPLGGAVALIIFKLFRSGDSDT
jgi:hypothetical protein